MSALAKEERELFLSYYLAARRAALSRGRSVGPNGVCAYRALRYAACPVRCGVGSVLLDSTYDPAMEGFVVNDQLLVSDGEGAPRWATEPGDYGPELTDKELAGFTALARSLTASGVPASANSLLFLTLVQEAHDGSPDAEHYVEQLDAAAATMGLFDRT